MKKKVYRNTAAFKLLAWGSFALFVILILIGLCTLKEPLMVCSDPQNIDFLDKNNFLSFFVILNKLNDIGLDSSSSIFS